MGMKDYQITLSSIEKHLTTSQEKNWCQNDLVSSLKEKWLHIKDCRRNHSGQQQCSLVYLTSMQAFELLIEMDSPTSSLRISLRFDYCNPTTIYEPICEIIEWLMIERNMICQPMREAGRDANGSIINIKSLTDVSELKTVLTPSMEYKRAAWMAWAGEETAKKRMSELILRLHQECSDEI